MPVLLAAAEAGHGGGLAHTLILWCGFVGAWLLVAGGASFIAVKETWELADHLGWHPAVYGAVVVAMAFAAVAHTAVRMSRGRAVVDGDSGPALPGA